jgi:Flp pilus assembly pilin Flp
MVGYFRKFLRDSDGAVTVDWVVITAGVVALALFVLSPFGLGPLRIAESVTEELGSVGDRFFGEEAGEGD